VHISTHRDIVSLLATAAVICRLAVDDLRRCFSNFVVYIQYLSLSQLLVTLITKSIKMKHKLMI